MGYPKALLPYRKELFVDALVELFSRHCSPVIVVVGAHAEQIRAGARQPATFVTNRDWRRGQTSSLQCGLAEIPFSAEGVLLTLVDHPAVSPATVERLLGLGPPEPTSPGPGLSEPLLRIPRYHSRGGHPIWFSREVIPELLAVSEPLTAKDVVHAHRAETLFLDVDDPGVVADIDDREAYQRLIGAGS